MPIPSEYPRFRRCCMKAQPAVIRDSCWNAWSFLRPTGDQNRTRFTPVIEVPWCHRNSFFENSNLLVYWRDVNLIWLPFQPTGVLKKGLPFIVNHENLNFTGIRRLLRKSKVCLIFYIPGYFLTPLELVKSINRNKTINHRVNLSRNI